MKKQDIQIQMMPVQDLEEYENNTRQHGQIDIDAIKESIEAFGFNDPIGIWSERNIIVEGHGRLAAANALGMEEVPCIRLDHLTDEERKAYAIAHNKTAELSKWNFAELNLELAGIKSIDMTKLGFAKVETSQAYEEFEQKFVLKKTTDDCYTPRQVYKVVEDYVADTYKTDQKNFLRPFYPGGDYQKEKYPAESIVVDNPPFSIFSEIINWYNEKSVKYFLFAPALTILNYTDKSTAIALQVQVEYENGAKVPTSFVTNLEDENIRIRTDPELYKAISEASKEAAKDKHREMPKYDYPDNVVTAAMMGKWSKYGICQEFTKESSVPISQLDDQKSLDKAIYGKGLLLSERAAAERAAAHKWKLSEREKQIIASLK